MLFAIGFYGQRSQINVFCNVEAFVCQEETLVYVPETEKTYRPDSVIPCPSWLIPVFLLHRDKIRKILAVISFQKLGIIVNAMWLSRDGNFISVQNRNRFVIRYFTYLINRYAFFSEAKTLRRGIFTKYVSSNFDRFYDLLGFDDNQMVHQLAKALNTSESIIHRHYVRSNSISKSAKLINTIRTDVIHDSNVTDFFEPVYLDNSSCESLGIPIIDYATVPTKRSYIMLRNNTFVSMFQDKEEYTVSSEDVLMFSLLDGIPHFKIPKFRNLVRIPGYPSRPFFLGNPKFQKKKNSVTFGVVPLARNRITIGTMIQITKHSHVDPRKYASLDPSCTYYVRWSSGIVSPVSFSAIPKNLFNQYLFNLLGNGKLQATPF